MPGSSGKRSRTRASGRVSEARARALQLFTEDRFVQEHRASYRRLTKAIEPAAEIPPRVTRIVPCACSATGWKAAVPAVAGDMSKDLDTANAVVNGALVIGEEQVGQAEQGQDRHQQIGRAHV